MEIATEDSIRKENLMAKDNIHGSMVVCILENSNTDSNMGKENGEREH
jgi:hypothetical protein